MSYENIIVEIGDDFVAEITLNRPDSLNTFNIPLARELNQALKELDSENKARVIILKGAGKAFCAVENPLITISRISKPVIAQVHGVAAANGAGLVAAADLAIAGEKARMEKMGSKRAPRFFQRTNCRQAKFPGSSRL